jgi:hypothetical protein
MIKAKLFSSKLTRINEPKTRLYPQIKNNTNLTFKKKESYNNLILIQNAFIYQQKTSKAQKI